MEGFITSIVAVLIISLISSVIKNAKKNLQNPNQQNSQSNNQPQSLQSIIRDQVNQHKDSLMEQFNGIVDLDNSKKDARYSEGDALKRKTLEGTPVEHQRHTHDAHIGGSYNEGDKLNRSTLEGVTLEGRKSSNDGMSLDALDIDNSDVLSASKVKKIRKNTGVKKNKGLRFDSNNIVNGIIMSEVLTRRGSRR